MTRELDKHNIPWSINVANKFYNYNLRDWFTKTEDAGSKALRDAILDPNKVAIYEGLDYSGNSHRLAIGQYTKSQLQNIGFYQNAKSIMIPVDFIVKIYTQDNFSGTEQLITETTGTLDGLTVSSVKVEIKNP